ncbi:hypothetical protein TVAG_317790 [Trichomonas vaginalis G3]|uniref:Uncharacterized protein n=1 Tax=Trichomonas vaginalis (strain ATCC PRA-98 / G3) TaxID=412133 RepID=A2F3M6_TRIV3|nr:hypothetical protein TVAGG3_0551620 [Trichomonas vaginalis G3]EAY00494.1 hypothetical protein TVAG_317790 [Trichomonas vaginalis G3]KAI5520548.1 hypothetical protein TVAGG3_0551620 [Trichomonas vaginalis G3]|eukprot:XP_001313423.1 hypothetical protein [Trichomonas vaginalis G3]
MNPIEVSTKGTFDIMNTFNSLTKFIMQGSPLEYPVLYAHALQQKYEDFNEYEQEIEEFFIKVRISILCCKHPNSIALYSLRFNYFLDLFIDNLSEDNADFFEEKLPSLYILEHAPTEDMPPIETEEIIPTNITIDSYN